MYNVTKNMTKKKVIWFIGSNATGKTTQSKLLHKAINDDDESKLFVEYEFEDGEVSSTIKVTQYNHSGHVGFLKDNQCTGTDTINSKSAIDATFCYLLDVNHIDVIIVDGIMATSTWFDIFNQFPDLVDIHIVLLQFPTLEDNLQRVITRRLDKEIAKSDGSIEQDHELLKGMEERLMDELNEKTFKNVSSKFTGFKSMYEKLKHRCWKCVEIDANLPVLTIHGKIFNFIQDDLPF